jgi:hypothetical protein
MNKCDGVGLQIHVAPRMGVVEKEEMYDEVRKKKETKFLLFLFSRFLTACLTHWPQDLIIISC